MIILVDFLIFFMGLLFIVGMRPFGVGGVGFAKTLWSNFIGGWDQIWFLPPPFFSVSLVSLLVGLEFWLVLTGLMKNSVKLGLPYFCRSGRREASLKEFNEEVFGLLPLVEMPPLTRDDLFQVVRRKTATAGSLDGWGWRKLKYLPVPWFHGLARIRC